MAVKIGFFGAGAMARAHAAALQTLETEVVAVCDIAAPRAAQFGADFGAEVFSSPNRMLSGASLDALYICTPPGVRGPTEIAAAKLGISLFIEAPVALNLRTAQSVASAVTKNGVLCAVGSAWRYAESTTRLRKTIAPKNAPPVLLMNGKWFQTAHTDAWRADPKLSGGLWLDSGYPLLDLARQIGGEVKKVSAFADSLERKTALLQFENGALGTLSVCNALESGKEHELSVATPNALHFLRDAHLETRHENETLIFCGNDHPIVAQNAAFVRALNNGKRAEIRTPYADAMKTLRLGLALGRAGLGSKAVRL